MTTDTRRPTGLLRTSTALTGAALLLGSLTLGACSSTDATASAQVRPAQAQPAAVDGDTVDLVAAAVDTPAADTPAADDANGNATAKADRKGLRARLFRALHATWVTGGGKAGPVTHQAVRGEVTAVSATAITVRAKDGFSLTYAVGADTKVRERPQVKGQGKATPSTVSAVRVGAKALVTGVGATKPTARVVVFKDAPAASGGAPTPSATS